MKSIKSSPSTPSKARQKLCNGAYNMYVTHDSSSADLSTTEKTIITPSSSNEGSSTSDGEDNSSSSSSGDSSSSSSNTFDAGNKSQQSPQPARKKVRRKRATNPDLLFDITENGSGEKKIVFGDTEIVLDKNIRMCERNIDENLCKDLNIEDKYTLADIVHMTRRAFRDFVIDEGFDDDQIVRLKAAKARGRNKHCAVRSRQLKQDVIDSSAAVVQCRTRVKLTAKERLQKLRRQSAEAKLILNCLKQFLTDSSNK